MKCAEKKSRQTVRAPQPATHERRWCCLHYRPGSSMPGSASSVHAAPRGALLCIASAESGAVPLTPRAHRHSTAPRPLAQTKARRAPRSWGPTSPWSMIASSWPRCASAATCACTSAAISLYTSCSREGHTQHTASQSFSTWQPAMSWWAPLPPAWVPCYVWLPNRTKYPILCSNFLWWALLPAAPGST
jgi:hypothetical protein